VIGTAGGHSTDALTTAQEAVDRYRQLAALNRDAHLPNLAAAVNNLANRLAETGRRTPGRPGAAQEAVWLFRQARQIHGLVGRRFESAPRFQVESRVRGRLLAEWAGPGCGGS
jgi:hypothetical protein